MQVRHPPGLAQRGRLQLMKWLAVQDTRDVSSDGGRGGSATTLTSDALGYRITRVEHYLPSRLFPSI